MIAIIEHLLPFMKYSFWGRTVPCSNNVVAGWVGLQSEQDLYRQTNQRLPHKGRVCNFLQLPIPTNALCQWSSLALYLVAEALRLSNRAKNTVKPVLLMT
jgi:hypothetical protein